MSRTLKIKKLSNAIRAYKGAKLSVNGPFVIQPQPNKSVDICRLLEQLGFDESQQTNAVREIDAFKTYDDFGDWIKKIQNKT